jgi:hypothetical protein
MTCIFDSPVHRTSWLSSTCSSTQAPGSLQHHKTSSILQGGYGGWYYHSTCLDARAQHCNQPGGCSGGCQGAVNYEYAAARTLLVLDSLHLFSHMVYGKLHTLCSLRGTSELVGLSSSSTPWQVSTRIGRAGGSIVAATLLYADGARSPWPAIAMAVARAVAASAATATLQAAATEEVSLLLTPFFCLGMIENVMPLHSHRDFVNF